MIMIRIIILMMRRRTLPMMQMLMIIIIMIILMHMVMIYVHDLHDLIPIYVHHHGIPMISNYSYMAPPMVMIIHLPVKSLMPCIV